MKVIENERDVDMNEDWANQKDLSPFNNIDEDSLSLDDNEKLSQDDQEKSFDV